jgi:uncharacterized membrane protein YqjE
VTWGNGRTERRWAGQPYPLEEPQRSLGDLVSDLTSDLGDMVQAHVELAKTEMREEASKAGKAAGLLAVAGVTALLALIILSMAAAWALAEAFESVWLGFLVVGLVWTVVAAVLAMVGRQRLSDVRGPRETQQTLSEDKQWLREQTH